MADRFETELLACDMREAERLTGYSRSRLYLKMGVGELKTWKVGRKRVTSPTYLREMIEADRLASEGTHAA
jgi:hypothetical protein